MSISAGVVLIVFNIGTHDPLYIGWRANVILTSIINTLFGSCVLYCALLITYTRFRRLKGANTYDRVQSLKRQIILVKVGWVSFLVLMAVGGIGTAVTSSYYFSAVRHIGLAIVAIIAAFPFNTGLHALRMQLKHLIRDNQNQIAMLKGKMKECEKDIESRSICSDIERDPNHSKKLKRSHSMVDGKKRLSLSQSARIDIDNRQHSVSTNDCKRNRTIHRSFSINEVVSNDGDTEKIMKDFSSFAPTKLMLKRLQERNKNYKAADRKLHVYEVTNVTFIFIIVSVILLHAAIQINRASNGNTYGENHDRERDQWSIFAELGNDVYIIALFWFLNYSTNGRQKEPTQKEGEFNHSYVPSNDSFKSFEEVLRIQQPYANGGNK